MTLIYVLIRPPHTIDSADVIELGFPEQLLQLSSGRLQISFLLFLKSLSNICQGQTAVMSLLLRADYTNRGSVYLIKESVY